MNDQPEILVVDDEESIRKLVKARFEREYYTVHTAENANQAIQMLNANPKIAITITDIKMPGKSGLELTQDIKRAHPHTKVIVMTGHGEKSTAIEALQKGASYYIEKPFDLNEMGHAVDRAKKEIYLETSNVVSIKTGALVTGQSQAADAPMNFTQMKKQAGLQFEKEYLDQILTKHQGNVTSASKEAGLDRSNFLRLLRRHQIQAQSFRIKKAA